MEIAFCPVCVLVAHHDLPVLSVQHIMNFSRSQKAALFGQRRNYFTQMAQISTRRQQLLQQLNSLPDPMNLDAAQVYTRNLAADDITQQLQGLMADELRTYLHFLRAVGHKVRGGTLYPIPYTPISCVTATSCHNSKLSTQ